MDNEVKKLYSALIGKGYTTRDLGDEQTFMGKMQDADNRKQLYDWVNARGDFRIGSYEDYEKRLTAPPAPKAEEINLTSDKSGYTLTAEELVLPDNTFRSESTSVAKLPEIKPLGAQNVKTDPEKLKPQGEALDNLNKEKELLEAQLDEVRRKASERRKTITSNAGAYQFGMAPVTGNVTREVADIEMAKLGATENQLVQAIREVDRKISGEDAGFWQGVLDATVRNPGFYTMGMSDMSDARAMLDLSENGINSETDLALADATYENSTLQEEADRGFMYRAGNIFGHSIPFIVQMAASGGGTGISKLGGKAAQTFAKETLKHKILRATGVVADDLLESAFIANTAGAGSTQANILQRKAGQLRKDAQDGYYFEGKNGWLESVAKGEMSSILEQYAEKLGNHLDGKLSITKGLDKIGAKRISTALAAAKNSDIGKAANTVLTQFGINGVLPEVMEEEANLVLNSIFVGDNKLSDLFDTQTQLDIVGGMFLTVGTMRAIPGAIGSVGYIRNQRKLNAADKEAEAVYGEKWAEMRERLNNASNEEVSDVCFSMIGSGDDQALIDYYASMMVMRGYNIGTTKREDNIPGAEQSYQEGYEAADEQKGAVKQAYDMERERVLNTFGEEVVQRLDDDPVGALMELNEIDRQEAIDYVNARTAYEGMIDHISDDIDERVKASDKEIDSHKNRQDGAIRPAMMRGVNGAAPKRVYIVNGNVEIFEDGTIDKANSSSMIIVRDAETGEVSAASADDLESLDAVIDTEAEKKSVAEQIANEYAGQQAAIIEGENEVQPEVAPVVEDQIGANTGKVVESSPTGEAAAPVVDKKARRAELEAVIPVEGKKKMFTKVEPVVTAEYIQLLTEDVDKQMATADKYIANIKAAQEKADPIEALEMDEQITYWESVKALLQGGQPTAETVPVVEETQAPVVESAPVAEVETPQATNEMQEADLTEDVKTEDVNQSENNLEMVAEGSAPGDDALSPAFATQERKGGTITLHTKTETKKGVKTTRVVAMRNGSEVSIPTAAFPVPEGMTLTDIPEGVEVTGVKELQEGNDGKTAATVLVKYEDGGLDTMETRVVKPAGETTVSQTSDQVSDQEKQSTQSVGEQVQAAEAEVNTTPTDAQKEAGNYKKGHVKIGPFNISIEQPKGSVRSGVDKDGKKWEVEMQNTYGYFRGTEGVDGDHIDVFLPNDIDGWDGRQVFVVDQRNADGSFDEHKVMLGFNDINDAEAAYMSNYEEGWQGLGAITGVSIKEFEKWLSSSHRKTKAFAEYKNVKTDEGQSTSAESGVLLSDEVADAGPVNMETLQLNMSEEDFNALLSSGDKAAISKYLAEMDGLLRIGVGSPLDGRDAIVKEYRGLVEQYGGEENIPTDVVAGINERIAPYNALQRVVFDRKYALQDKLREIEASEAQAKEQAEKEAKAEHKQTAFGGFLAGKSDVGASTAEKALNKKYDFDGKVMTVAEFVEDAVGNGNGKISAIEEPKYKGASRQAWNRMDARQQEADAKRVKESGTKTVYTVNDHDLGKTAYDYAKFLLDKKAEQEKAAAKQKVKDAIEPFAKEKAAEQAPIKIEDVGEKIGGARKDIIRQYADKIKLDGKTFSTMFPKPDIDKLIEAGLPVDKVAAVKAMYDNAKREFEMVKKRRGKDKALQASLFYAMYAKNVLTGEEENFDLAYNGFVFTEWGKEFMKANIALYKAVFNKLGTDYGKVDLRSYFITPLAAGMRENFNIKKLNEENSRMQQRMAEMDGRKVPEYKDGDVINFVGEHYSRPSDQFETLEEAVNTMVERISKEVKVDEAAQYKVELYWKRDAQGRADYTKAYLGIKVRGFGTVDVMEFKNMNEARAWLQDHGEDFQQMAAAKEEQVRAEKKKPLPKYVLGHSYNEAQSQYSVFADFGKEGVKILKTFDIPQAEGVAAQAKVRSEVYKNEVLPYINSEEAVQSADGIAQEIRDAKDAKPKSITIEKKSRERVGVDWRNGKDATPEMFVDVEGKEPSVFGFRAIEFGNYVSQKERQQFLNDIYDALMDMSEVLGVSPRALSLGGKLALAVGARGTSGASGHYEPYKNVINITKTRGAGVLAHEWLHALDRYFSNFDENMVYPNGTRYATQQEYADDTRQEVKDAFEKVMLAVKASDYRDRSMRLGEYWASEKELSARALQDYVIRKLEERGQKNDFLSNHVAPEEWDGDAKDYPFPLGEDAKRIADAFDNLFATLEEKTTEEGDVVLYRSAEDNEARAITYDEAVQIVNDFNKTFKGAAKRVVVSKGKDALEQQMRDAGFDEGDIALAMAATEQELPPMAGHLWGSDGIVVFRYDTDENLYEALWHENTHRALRKLYGNNRTLAQTRFDELPEHIKQEYVDFLKAAGYKVNEYAEETLCYFVGSRPRLIGYLKDGRNDLTSFYRFVDKNYKRFIDFAQNLIDYTVYHEEEIEHRERSAGFGEIAETTTEGGNGVHQRNSEDGGNVQGTETSGTTGGLTESEIALLEASTGYTREEIIDMFGYDLNRSGAGPLTDREVVMESDPYSKVLGKPRYYGKRQREFVARQRRRMAEKARQVAEKLNLDNVEVLESTEGLTGKKATSKGWFDPRTGKITVVVPNHGSIDDIVETVLHEAVAHYGLRKLFGENFKNFLDNVYRNVTPEIREEIAELAKKHGWDFHTATEEYLASLAENTNFEKVNPSLWSNIKSFFMKMLAKAGITLDEPLGDNELRYILWRSHQNLVNPGWFNVFGQAEDIAKQYELGVGNYASGEVAAEDDSALLHREGGAPGSAREEYERKVRRPNKSGSVGATENVARRAQEAYQDSMLALKILQDAVARETGNEVKDNENAYIAENRMSSSNKAMVEIYERDFFMPLMDEINALIKKGVEYDDIIRYLHAKHGLERNEYMRRKQAEEAARRELGEEPTMPNEGDADYEAKVNAKAAWRANLAELTESYVKKFAKRDYSGLTALTETANAKDAEAAAQQMVDEFENDHDTTPLWEAVNKATKETLRREFVGGLIDRATYDTVSTMFDFYIPLRGWDDNVAANEYEYFANNNTPVFTPAIKTMHGRKSLSDDPIATIGYMAGSAIARANRNLMKQKFLNFVMNNPTSLATVSEQWYTMDYGTNEWVPNNPAIPEDATPEQVVEIVEAHEANMRALEKAGLATRERSGLKIGLHATKQEQQQHVVRVMRNGKEYAVYINGNPRAAQALNGMTNPDVSKSKAREAAQNVKNFMARAFTSRNPAFIISNSVRDVIWAGTAVAAKEDAEYTKQYTKNVTGVLAKFKLPRLLRKFQKGTLDLNNEIERYFDEFLRNGGETGFTQVLAVEDYKRNIKRFTKEAKNGTSIPKKAWRGLWNGIGFLSRSAEDITRFTVYMTSRQMGRSIERSVYDAKEITVNFNKKGSGEMGAKYLNFAYIFFNATIQSLANFGKLVYRHPGKMAAALGTFGMMGFLMPVINAALMALGDDDDMENYWNLPEWVRRNSIVLFAPWTEKGFITIPLPHELRPFYGMGENAMSALQGKQTAEDAIKKSLVGFTGMLPIDFTANGGDVVVNVMPTILQPLAQVKANVTHFGTPIYKDKDFNKRYPSWTKAYKGTNSTLVAATKWLNELGGGNNVDSDGLLDWNPAVIEHLFESYLGGMGKTFNKAATTVSMLWDEDARIARNIPVASSFYQESDERTAGSQLNREYFDALEEMEGFQHRLSGYQQQITKGNAEYKKLFGDLVNSDDLKRYGIIKKYSNAISELNQVLKNNGPTEEKAEEIEGVIQELKKEMLDKLEKLQAEE